MRYRYKFKGSSAQNEKKEENKRDEKKIRVLYLALWSAISIGLYFAFSKYFATTTIQVCEVLLFSALVLYFAYSVRLNRYLKRSTDSEETKNETKEKFRKREKSVLIFVIPLLFIIMYDFIVVSLKFIVK